MRTPGRESLRLDGISRLMLSLRVPIWYGEEIILELG
jgi:hypothetical protein